MNWVKMKNKANEIGFDKSLYKHFLDIKMSPSKRELVLKNESYFNLLKPSEDLSHIDY